MRKDLKTVALTLGLAAILIAGGSVQAAGAGARYGHGYRSGHGDVDTVASSQPTEANPTDSEWVLEYRHRHARRLKADAVATTSAVCDGCTGDAVALQVVRGHRVREATADNVASAWTACEASCSVSGLSVQLVVLSRARELEVNNRALALNSGCKDCRAVSAAYQIAIVDPDARGLSRDERRELEAMVAQLHDEMQTATASERRGRRAARRAAVRVADASLDDLAAFAADATGGAVTSKDADVRVR